MIDHSDMGTEDSVDVEKLLGLSTKTSRPATAGRRAKSGYDYYINRALTQRLFSLSVVRTFLRKLLVGIVDAAIVDTSGSLGSTSLMVAFLHTLFLSQLRLQN